MRKSTSEAYEVMKKVLKDHDDKLLQSYLLACKIDLVIQELIGYFGEQVHNSGTIHYFKTAAIQTHKTILTFLEVSTAIVGGAWHNPSTSKYVSSTRTSLELALTALMNICKVKE